jgi:hypothetical protein
MGTLMDNKSAEMARVIKQAGAGDKEALSVLFGRHVDAMDREVLSLRHFEELSLAETALSLGIEESAAAKRYIRALKRLKVILANMPGGLSGV